jgi:hypothetical protein
MKHTITQDERDNTTSCVCKLHVQIAARNYAVYLFRWKMTFGLQLLSTEVRSAQLKVTAHIPPMW